jgi:hypothetical protein
LIGKFSSVRRACNNDTVRSSFNSTQVYELPGSASKFEDNFAGLPQLGVRSENIELLEQVKRLRLGAGEVVPRVLPAKAIQALVEVFRPQAILGADAVDFVLPADAVPEAASRQVGGGGAKG